MVKSTTLIETGVDKLVNLVNTKKKISVPEAAETLGVSPAVVEEWADFLEEEGLISIDYTLATTFLVERKLTKKEVIKKAKEFHSSKDAFVRNVETAMHSLENDTSLINNIKREFLTLKKEIGDDIASVNEELKELEKYEELKKSIDKQLLEQHGLFKDKIMEMDKELFKEKQKYQEVLDDIEIEKVKLEKERSEMLSLKEQEAMMFSKLNDFTLMINRIRSLINEEENKVDISEKHIEELEKKAERLKNEVEKFKQGLEPLFQQSKAYEKNIFDQQQKIISKVTADSGYIDATVNKGRKVAESFKKFFEKKSKVENLANKINEDNESLKKDMAALIKKAHAFNLTTQSSDVKEHISQLEENFKKIEQKRIFLKDEIHTLMEFIKGNF